MSDMEKRKKWTKPSPFSGWSMALEEKKGPGMELALKHKGVNKQYMGWQEEHRR
jgi:hypothetical protein